MTTEIIEQPKAALATTQPSIVEAISAAIQSGRTVEELRELMAFAKDLRAEAALTEFNHAMAEFKRTCPRIAKRTENAQFKVTRDGVQRPSRFASMADISYVIDGPLSAVGLSYTFTDADTKSEPGKMIVGAIISHAGGHVAAPKYVTMPCDTGGAGSSPQQKIGSVMQYAMRYALTAALGLVGCDDDDNDGNMEPGGSTQSNIDKITDAQSLIIQDKLIELADARKQSNDQTVKMFKQALRVAAIADIPAADFNKVFADIEKKIATAKAATK